mmetsp:Transcript_2507/g.7138  ORF Transcript_2507/g.7138 Transcript_2507/m.7138 type:complete len:170 (+) Transcript_2507:3-512(+)
MNAMHDGVIDKGEWMNAMHETTAVWGFARFFDDPEVVDWLEGLFERADLNSDGVMSPEEIQFTAYLGEEAYERGDFSEKILASFYLNDFDVDGDGKISKSEVQARLPVCRAALKGLMAKDPAAADTMDFLDRFRDMFHGADVDGSSELDEVELLELCRAIVHDFGSVVI